MPKGWSLFNWEKMQKKHTISKKVSAKFRKNLSSNLGTNRYLWQWFVWTGRHRGCIACSNPPVWAIGNVFILTLATAVSQWWIILNILLISSYRLSYGYGISKIPLDWVCFYPSSRGHTHITVENWVWPNIETSLWILQPSQWIIPNDQICGGAWGCHIETAGEFQISTYINRNRGNVTYMRQNPTNVHSPPTYCGRC